MRCVNSLFDCGASELVLRRGDLFRGVGGTE